MDITCNKAGSGGLYYSEHLRKLGEPVQIKYKTETSKRNIVQKDNRKQPLKTGDKVRVDLPVKEVISLNERLHGWTKEMEEASTNSVLSKLTVGLSTKRSAPIWKVLVFQAAF